jgi:hypothetical protein
VFKKALKLALTFPRLPYIFARADPSGEAECSIANANRRSILQMLDHRIALNCLGWSHRGPVWDAYLTGKRSSETILIAAICFFPSVLFGDLHIQRMFIRRFTVPLK